MNDTKEELLKQSDNYHQTVLGLKALRQHLEFEYDAELEIGRRMTTSSDNRITEEEDITPDGVAILSQNIGLIIEAKKTIPQDDGNKKSILKQLLKYDDDLEGWKEAVENHDILCLTHSSNSRNLFDYIEEKREEGEEITVEKEEDEEVIEEEIEVEFERPLVVCGFNRSSERNEYVFFRKVRGGDDLSHDELDERIDEELQVAMKYFIEEYSENKFSDDEPPMPYLLSELWSNVFNTMISEERFSSSGGISSMDLEVTVEELTEYVQKNFGQNPSDERQQEIPKKSWIKEALECLIELGLAEKSEGEGYTISYRNLKTGQKNMTEHFADELADEYGQLEKFLK